MISITCKHCRHTADYDAFTSTTVTGPLPDGQFQCPRCHRAWKLVPKGTGRYLNGGLYIPAPRTIQETTALL